MRPLLLILNALTFLAAFGFLCAIVYDVAIQHDPVGYVLSRPSLFVIFGTFAMLPFLSAGLTLIHLIRRRGS